MIEKLNVAYIQVESDGNAKLELSNKINELVDAVNKLETMAKNTNTVLESLVQENNIHEKQINELQMKLEPHKCEPAENGKCAKNAQDAFAEQRKWVGKICKFWNDDGILDDVQYGELVNIWDTDDCPFQCGNGEWWEYCEPVKPDDDIIYKGGNNE